MVRDADHILLLGDTMQRLDERQRDLLTAALPPELWTLPPELAAADRLLDDPTVLQPLLDKLDPVRGRPSIPVAQVLQLLYLQWCYQLSDREIMREVGDSFHWRRFNTLILDNTRTTRPGASLGTISRARARGLWPGRFSLSCPALRI